MVTLLQALLMVTENLCPKKETYFQKQKSQHTLAKKSQKRLALIHNVSPSEGRFPDPLFGPTSQEALSMMGEAFPYFLTCPSSKFLEACQ